MGRYTSTSSATGRNLRRALSVALSGAVLIGGALLGGSTATAASVTISLDGGGPSSATVTVGDVATFVNNVSGIPISADVNGVTVSGTVQYSATISFADGAGASLAPGQSWSRSVDSVGPHPYSVNFGYDVVGINADEVGVALDDAYAALLPVAATTAGPAGGSASIDAVAVVVVVPPKAPGPTKPTKPRSTSAGAAPSTVAGATAPASASAAASRASASVAAGSSSSAAAAASAKKSKDKKSAANSVGGTPLSIDGLDGQPVAAALVNPVLPSRTGVLALFAILILAAVSTVLTRFYIYDRDSPLQRY